MHLDIKPLNLEIDEGDLVWREYYGMGIVGCDNSTGTYIVMDLNGIITYKTSSLDIIRENFDLVVKNVNLILTDRDSDY